MLLPICPTLIVAVVVVVVIGSFANRYEKKLT